MTGEIQGVICYSLKTCGARSAERWGSAMRHSFGGGMKTLDYDSVDDRQHSTQVVHRANG